MLKFKVGAIFPAPSFPHHDATVCNRVYLLPVRTESADSLGLLVASVVYMIRRFI